MKLRLPRRDFWVDRHIAGDIGSFVTVDPGLGGTGFAVWSRKSARDVVPPILSGCVDHIKSDSWEKVATDIAWRLSTIIKPHAVFEMVIELPQLMNSGVGQIAARSGDLVKLTITTGCIMGIHSIHNSGRIEGVTPTQWKGNLDKEETDYRVRRALPGWKSKSNTTHEADAVGLGLWAKGAL